MISMSNMSMFYISTDVGAHIGHGTDIKFIVVQIHYAVSLPSKLIVFIYRVLSTVFTILGRWRLWFKVSCHYLIIV